MALAHGAKRGWYVGDTHALHSLAVMLMLRTCMRIVSAGSEDGQVHVWETATGQLLCLGFGGGGGGGGWGGG